MAKRPLFTLLFSIATLAAWYLLPANRDWFHNRILRYYGNIGRQRNHLDIEYRKVTRWGNAYTYSKGIADFLEQKGVKETALVALPPTSYFKANGLNYHVPEPAVFYYYTGLKTTWVNSTQATRANWFVRVQQGQLVLDSVKASTWPDTLSMFRKYPVSL
ncbi:MAG TPA: hypothetical protein VFZ78_00325 [Flavisolibacter sp.]